MPRASAAARALPRSREAIAESCVSEPFFMPGRLVFSAKRLAPRTPQRTGGVVAFESATADIFDLRCSRSRRLGFLGFGLVRARGLQPGAVDGLGELLLLELLACPLGLGAAVQAPVDLGATLS